MADLLASFGVGIDLLSCEFNNAVDTLITDTAQKLSNFGTQFSAAVSLPIGIIGRDIFTFTSEVDRAAREATALLAASMDVTTAESQAFLDSQYDEFIVRSGELAQQYGVNMVEILEATYFAVGTGFQNMSDALQVVEYATKAAQVGATDVTTSIEVLIGALNSYGYTAEQTAYVSDVLFQTVNIGKVEFDELAQSLADVLGVAPIAGASLEDLGAVIASATKSGQSASKTMTGLRQVIENIISPRGAGQKALAEMFDVPIDQVGIYTQELIKSQGFLTTLVQITDQFEDPYGRLDLQAAREVFRNVQGLTRIIPLVSEVSSEEAEVLQYVHTQMQQGADKATILSNAESKLAAITQQTGQATSTLVKDYLDMQRAQDGLGATTAAFTEIQKSVSFQAAQVREQFNSLKVVIGTELIASLRPVIDTVGRLAVLLRDFFEQFPKARSAVVTFGLIAVAVPPLIFAFSQLIGLVGSFIGLALNPLILGLGILVGRIASTKAAELEMADGLEGAEAKMMSFLNVIVVVGQTLAEIFVAAARHVTNFVDWLANAARSIAEFFGATFASDQMSDRVGKAVDQTSDEIDRLDDKLKEDRTFAPPQVDDQLAAKRAEDVRQTYDEEIEQEPGPQLPEPEAPDTEKLVGIARGVIRSIAQGMSEGQIDIFSDVGSLLQAEIGQLGLDAEQAASTLQQAQVALAQAVMGDVSGWERLRSIIGDVAGLIQEYVSARASADAAHAAVTAAENRRREEMAAIDSRIAAIREKIYDFERKTADVPERYTRHRKQQLDDELHAAENLRDQRQAALDAQVEVAQAAAEAADKNAALLLKRIQLEQQLLLEQQKSKEEEEDLIEPMTEVSEAMLVAQQDAAAFNSAIGDLGESLDAMSYFWKGLMGENIPEQEMNKLTTAQQLAFERGIELRSALLEIKDAFDGLVNSVRELPEIFSALWENMPEWLRDTISAGALLLGLNFVFKGLISGAVGGAASIAGLIVKTLTGGGLAASVGAGGLILLAAGLSIVAVKKAADLGAQIEQGYEDTRTAIQQKADQIRQDSDTALEAANEIIKTWEDIDRIYENANPIQRLLIDKEGLLGEVNELMFVVAEASTSYEEYMQTMELLSQQREVIPELPVLPLMSPEQFAELHNAGAQGAEDFLSGAEEELEGGIETFGAGLAEQGESMSQSLFQPLIDGATETANELVGDSIVPDMVESVLLEYDHMTNGILERMNMLTVNIGVWGNSFTEWWYQFVMNIETFTMTRVQSMYTFTMSRLSAMQTALSAFATTATATVVAPAGVAGATEATAPGGGYQQPNETTTLNITNNWDASVSEKDRAEIEASAEQATWNAIKTAYSQV